MGYGIILDDSSVANYSVIAATAYTNLPASPPVNTIGLITSALINRPYITNKTLSGLVNGDVVIRMGNPALNRFNAVGFGTIEVCPVDAYQQQSGALVRVPAFIYNGITWTLITGKFLEDGILASDTFTRSNGAIGTAEVGGSWNSSSVNVVSNKAKGTTATYVNPASLLIGQLDYAVYCDFTWYTGENLFLYARGGSAITSTSMILKYDGSILKIDKRISDSATMLASMNYTWGNAAVHRLGLAVCGNMFAAYVDGILVMTATDDNATKTLYRAGFGISNPSAVPSSTADNFLVVG